MMQTFDIMLKKHLPSLNRFNEDSVNSGNMSQSRWKGHFCKQNKLSKSASFISKFKAKHAIEEQSQCLEESQNCFESKFAEGFRFIDLNFFT